MAAYETVTEGKGLADKREEKDDVIKGYRVDSETICPACREEEELDEITKGDVLTGNDSGLFSLVQRMKG